MRFQLFPTSFIFLSLLFIQSTKSLQLFDQLPYQSLFQETPAFFESLTYLTLYIFSWNFLFEISLIIVIHFKQKAFYAAEHSFINMMAVVIQLINNFLLFKNKPIDFTNLFVIVELSVLLAITLQLVFGGWLNSKLQSEKLVKGIFILRFLHKNCGRLIYLVTKFQIANYAYYHLQNSSLSPVVFISVLFGITIITHISVYIILNAKVTEDMEVTDFLIISSPKSQEYLDLIRNIEAGEIDAGPELEITDRLSEIREDSVKAELVDSKQEIAWVIIEDKVYDITGLRHPKGNYILKSIRRKDITREIYGLKGWRFNEKGYVKFSKHRHVARTFQFLKQHCIAELSLNNVLTNSSYIHKASLSETTSNLNLFDSNLNVIKNPRRERINSWSCFMTHELKDSVKIIFLSKIQKDHVVNLSSFWLRNFGKYYWIRNEQGITDYFYNSLSLSPKYLYTRKEYYNSLNFSFMDELNNLSTEQSNEICDLYPNMKATYSDSLRALIENNEDCKDAFLPLLYVKSDHTNMTFSPQSCLKVNGPIGLGPGFEPNSTKKIIIMAKDSGILPFTDFLEYVGQRSLIELDNFAHPHPIFTKEYMLYYINEISIWLYWEVSAEFLETAELTGLSSLKTLNLVSKESLKGQTPISDKSDCSKIINSFKHAVIVNSNYSNQKEEKISNIQKPGEDFLQIKELTAGDQSGLIDRVIVSGDMVFVNRVLKNVDVSDEQVMIL